MYLIYCARNLVNGKHYVGRTRRPLEERRWEHFSQKTACRRFQNAIKHHGREAFVWEVLEAGIAESDAAAREEFWIAQKNAWSPNGYNLASVQAAGPCSAETRAAMSAGQHRRSPEDRARQALAIAASNRRNAETPEWQRAHATAMAEVHTRPDWLENVRVAAARRADDPTWRARNRAATARNGAKYRKHAVEYVAMCVCAVTEDGLTRKEVARRASVSGSVVGDWVHGKTRWGDALHEFFPERYLPPAP